MMLIGLMGTFPPPRGGWRGEVSLAQPAGGTEANGEGL